MSPELKAAIERANAIYKAMSPEQKIAHDQAQRESFVRGMMAQCEHGEYDFEQCVQCTDAARKRIKEKAAP